MSLWTDIRDAVVGIVTAPVRIPAQIIGDVIGGKNVFDSAGKAILSSVAVSNPIVKQLTIAQAVAPGAVKAAGNFVPGLSDIAQAGFQITAQNNPNKSAAMQLGEGYTKFGVTAAGAILAGTGGLVAGKALASGDVKGALAAGVGSAGLGESLPPELLDSVNETADLARAIASRPASTPAAAPIVNVQPSKSTTTALAPVVGGGPSAAQLAVVAVALGAGLLLNGRGRK